MGSATDLHLLHIFSLKSFSDLLIFFVISAIESYESNFCVNGSLIISLRYIAITLAASGNSVFVLILFISFGNDFDGIPI